MRNTIALTTVTLAITAMVIGMTTIGTAQIANAQGRSDEAYGKEIIAPNARAGGWGGAVSDAARDDSGQGIGDFRANGCKQQELGGPAGCSSVPP